MKKASKRIFTAIISVVLACVMVFSVACGTDTDTPYTISVVNADNTAVTNSSIQVTFTNPDDATQIYSVALGSSGTLSADFNTVNAAVTSGTKRVTLTNLGSYYYTGEYTVSAESRSATITLAKQADYKVSVTYADETAVTNSNMLVSFSNPSVSTESYQVALGSTGTVSVDYATLNAAVTSDVKNVQISGYSSSYYYVSGTVSDSSRSATLVLQKQTDYSISVKDTDGELIKNSNIMVNFADPEDRSRSYSVALGATGALTVDYATLNAAIPTSTKLVSLSGVDSDKYYDTNLTITDESRNAEFKLNEYSYYSITVKYNTDVLMQDTTGLVLQLTDSASSPSTYSAELSETGITTFYADELEKVLNLDTTVTVRLVGFNSNYTIETDTLTKTDKSATITVTPMGTIGGHFAEYRRANPNEAVTMESWLLGLINDFILPEDGQASIASYDPALSRVTVYFANNTTNTYGITSRINYITFTDDAGVATRINVYKTTVYDQSYNPVKDVCLRFTYISDYVARNVASAISSESGLVIFYATHVANRVYQVRLEDFSIDANVPAGYLRALPTGYSNPNVEGVMENGIVSVAAGTYSVTYPVYYSANSFYMSTRTSYTYDRYIYGESTDTHVLGAGAKLDAVQERNENLNLMLSGGIYSYFSFQSYLEPGQGPDDGTETTDQRQANADLAASGIYRITLSATEPTARLYYFASTLMQDANGIPTDIGAATGYGGETYYTGTDYIELNLRIYNNESRIVYYFGVVADEDCRATIIIERIGDAVEPPEVQIIEVLPQVTLTQYADQQETVINDMPINGTFTAVYVESEDRYHINSATGPILHVQLTKNMQRLFTETNISLQNLPQNNDLGESVYMFTTMDETGDHPVTRHTYVKFVADYAAVANTQGLYPVTREMQEFLVRLADKGIGLETHSAEEGCGWYAFCQYYGILEVTGEGTAATPFNLTDGESYVRVSETPVYAKIELDKGVAVFSSATIGVTYTGTIPHYTVARKNASGDTTTYFTYFNITEDSVEVVMQLTRVSGTDPRGSITVAYASSLENTIEDAMAGSVKSGIDEESAIAVNGGIFNINSISQSGYVADDAEKNQRFTYLSLSALSPARFGEYQIKVFGTGVIEYNGTTYKSGDTLTVNLQDNVVVVLKLSSMDTNNAYVDSNFLLAIEQASFLVA